MAKKKECLEQEDLLSSFIQENKKDGILYIEAENTLWKRDEETDEIMHEIDDEEFHPNALMALLYISRQYGYEVLNITDTNKEAKPIGRFEDEGKLVLESKDEDGLGQSIGVI